MKRYVGFFFLSVSFLFLFNFSLLSGIQNVFSSVASAIAGGIPQKTSYFTSGSGWIC
ncbi:hypothetical protein LEP1GSC106_0464 [Leptospira interrogans serovar Grippotyphosa str. UI 12764]|nr:hypothetical protein LEP1GSC106_0464 [Leptospira interrogans serovar Grippotyphosa str. UI 12764]